MAGSRPTHRVLRWYDRRRAGYALAAGGVAILMYVTVSVAEAELDEHRARSRWAAETARQTIERTRVEVDGGPVTGPAPAPGAPIGRLIIPAARIDEIVVEGVYADALMAGPGHVPASPMPGQPGNSVIAAHRDRHFRGLGSVSSGDTIVTETRQGTVRWVVTERRIRPAGAVVDLRTPEPLLTLSTCWPIMALGPAPDRLVITARRVS